MKITIKRHGGFAGISETVAVKDSAMPTSEAVALRTRVERIRRLSREHRPEGADFVQYELLIEDPGAKSVITFADDGSNEARELVELVDAITAAKDR